MRIALLILLLILPLGCRKTTATSGTATAPAPSSGSGGGNTNYVAGGGAVQNVRQAARRTITINDMNTLGQFVEIEFTNSGKMPSYNTIKDQLKREAPQVLSAITEGSIILCWTTSHEGIWAYEVDADTKGGVACVTARASRYDASQIKQMLGK